MVNGSFSKCDACFGGFGYGWMGKELKHYFFPMVLPYKNNGPWTS